ncbi:MAG: hypothetical protein ACI9WU_000434 [Myxococcota bacterium]|jgi:hypothetical protein
MARVTEVTSETDAKPVWELEVAGNLFRATRVDFEVPSVDGHR